MNYAYHCHVLLPLALPQVYTFGIPEELKDAVKPGIRVEVQFGKKRYYAGLVKDVFSDFDNAYPVKPVLNILDEKPFVYEWQMAFWEWIAEYYMATEGEVMNAALPAAFKLSSETKVLLNPTFKEDFSSLNDNEYLITEALIHRNELSIKEVKEIVELKSVYYLIKSLLEKNVIIVEEELKQRYKPKKENIVSLHPDFENDEALQKEVFQKLEKRAPKQMELLMAFYQIKNSKKKITRPSLLKRAGASASHLNGLVKKNILLVSEQDVSRLKSNRDSRLENYELTKHQSRALQEVRELFVDKPSTLLHGITSSGKTQIYIELMKTEIEKGNQCLYLLPEIAITTQIIERLRKTFGDAVGVYHSKFNNLERIEIWQKTFASEYKILVGPRSSLFLPIDRLSLIIIDEEQDSSYKQFDPAPRFNARDAAIRLGMMRGAKMLLGSATPSLETYRNAELEKFGLVELSERYGGVQPPKIELVDIKEATRKMQMKSHFSEQLINEIKSTIEVGEQVILFQNRRGYSPYIVCKLCHWIPNCVQCDVSLTYHKFGSELRCHYCGYRTKLPNTCVACGDHHLQVRGFGTEKIEEELGLIIPEARIARMDLDTVSRKNAHSKLIERFESHQLDILIGTQMVTKGLDFSRVSLVAILNADQLIRFPNLRVLERAYQLMVQVAGRAGRRENQGKVLIQTYTPDHPIFNWVIENDFQSFYKNEISERKMFSLPPDFRLIQITLKHRDKDKVNDASFRMTKFLKSKLGHLVLGPSVPIISFIRRYHLRNVLIKIPKNTAEIKRSKEIIKDAIDRMHMDQNLKSVLSSIDVDPI